MISGRSNDDFETVVSYGRRKREYNVLDSKILTQSVKIRVPDFEQSNDLTSQAKHGQLNRNSMSNRKMTNKFSTKSEQEEQLFLTNQMDESSDSKAQMNYLVNDLGHFCFEPTSLAFVSGFTLLIQGLFFSVAIILFYKTRFDEKSRRRYEIAF